jgi:hypothetical protein
MDPETHSRHHQRLTSGKDAWSARCGESRTPGAGGGPRETTGGNTGTAPASLPHHLLADAEACYTDLGSDFYNTRINPEHRKRNHIRQLEALGYTVTLEPAA